MLWPNYRLTVRAHKVAFEQENAMSVSLKCGRQGRTSRQAKSNVAAGVSATMGVRLP